MVCAHLYVRVRDADSGRVLTVFTNQPAVWFYTGDHLNFTGKNGHHYQPHSGFLVETQNYPDAVQHVCHIIFMQLEVFAANKTPQLAKFL